MGGINPFKKPDVPKAEPLPPPPPPPEPVNQADPAIGRRRKKERTRAALAGGRNSTILTSPQGLPSASGERKTVLGK